MKLEETVELMNGEDYKDRFKAEYYQTEIRLTKLEAMIVKYEAGKLDFTPVTPISLLKQQKRFMEEYLHCLKVRAAIEEIDLG